LAIKAPIPTSGELVNEARYLPPNQLHKEVSNLVHRLLEVLDKGKAAAVTSIVETKDKKTGKVIFENQSTVFIRGSGGFGGKREGKGMRTEGDIVNTPLLIDCRSRSCFCSQCCTQARS
jgi:multifunctional beta-oxidation protein